VQEKARALSLDSSSFHRTAIANLASCRKTLCTMARGLTSRKHDALAESPVATPRALPCN
jgi:hypothetical protein